MLISYWVKGETPRKYLSNERKLMKYQRIKGDGKRGLSKAVLRGEKEIRDGDLEKKHWNGTATKRRRRASMPAADPCTWISASCVLWPFSDLTKGQLTSRILAFLNYLNF